MFFYLTPAVFLVLAYLLLEEITSIIGKVIILIGTTITSNYSKESIWLIFNKKENPPLITIIVREAFQLIGSGSVHAFTNNIIIELS